MADTAVVVERPAIDLRAFDQQYGRIETDAMPLGARARAAARGAARAACAGAWWRGSLGGALPLVETLRTYRWRRWLLQDAVAGLSVGMVHIPQSMSFALLASVAPVYGLYATFWQVTLYMFLGQCRHLSMGTMAVISLMISPVVEHETALWLDARNLSAPGQMPLGANLTAPPEVEALSDEDRFRASVATGVSLVVGVTMLAMGMLRLGVLRTFMPPSFISGFTTGAAFHISCTQTKFVFNVKVRRYSGLFNLPRSFWEIFKALPETSLADLACSGICFAFLIFIKEFINVRFKKKLRWPIPADMFVVVLGTLVSYLAHLHERWGLGIIGFIPVGLPPPIMPNLDHADTFILQGIITGITSFAVSIAMVDLLTVKYKYPVNPNRELIAYGLTYGISSFFHCFAGAAAPPRCILLELTGGKTQVAGFFTSLLLLLVLLVIAPVFRYLPTSCLGCIIIVALFPLYKQFSVLPRLWRLSKPDFVIWIVTFLSAVFIEVSVGLGAGIFIAMFVSLLPALKAKGYRYGMTNHTDLRAPATTHSNVIVRDDIAIFRYESTLFYLTIKNFKQQLFQATVDPQMVVTSKQLMAASPVSLTLGGGKSEINGKTSNEITISGTTNGTPRVGIDTINSEAVKTNEPAGASTSPATSLKVIVLDCSPVGYIDLMGIDTLKVLHKEYQEVGIALVLADCNPGLLEKLVKAGMMKEGSDNQLRTFPTVQDAVATFMAESHQEAPRRSLCGNDGQCGDIIHRKHL